MTASNQPVQGRVLQVLDNIGFWISVFQVPYFFFGVLVAAIATVMSSPHRKADFEIHREYLVIVAILWFTVLLCSSMAFGFVADFGLKRHQRWGRPFKIILWGLTGTSISAVIGLISYAQVNDIEVDFLYGFLLIPLIAGLLYFTICLLTISKK
jgi:hypothetical protein